MPDETLRFALKVDSSGLVKGIDAMDKSFYDLSKAIDKTVAASKKAGKAMQSAFVSSARKIDKAVTGMAGRIVGAAGLGGIITTMYKSVGAAAEFESAIKEVATLLDSTGKKNLGTYKEGLIALSKETGKAATELSSGLYQVISAGTKGTEDAAGAMKLLKVATKAGVAGVADTFSAVDVLTTSLNAYNKTADEASKFSDTLFQAVKMGKINFQQLSYGMGQVASVAAGAGVTFEEVNASLAAMTKGGIMPARAFTGLQAVMRTLTQPSKELLDVFGGDLKGALKEKGLIGVMKKIKEVTKGDAFEMKKLVKETEAGVSMAVLAGTGFDNFKNTLEAMGKATGSTEEAYATMADTFEMKMGKFQAVMNEIFIKIGDAILPVIIENMELISDWISAHSKDIVDFFKNTFEKLEVTVRYIVDNAATVAKTMAWIWGVGKVGGFVKAMSAMGSVGKFFSPFVAAGSMIAADIAQGGGEAAFITPEMRARRQQDIINRGGVIETGEVLKKNVDEFKMEYVKAAKEVTAEVAAAGNLLTKEQIKAQKKAALIWKKGRAAAVKLLAGLERGQMEVTERIRFDMENQIESVQKNRFMKEEEKLRAIAIIQLNGEAKIDAVLEKRAAEEKKRANELARLKKAHTKYLASIDPYVQNVVEGYKEQRASWSAMAASRWGVKKKEGGGVGGWLKEVGTGALRRMGESALDMGVGLLTGGASPLGAIQGMLGAMFSGEGVEKMKEIGDQFKTFLEQLPTLLKEGFEWLVSEGIPTIISAFVDNLPDIVFELVKGMQKVGFALVAEVPKFIAALIESIPEIVTGFIVGLGEGLKDLLDDLLDWFGLKGDAFTKIEDPVEREKAIQAQVESMEDFTDQIGNAFNNVSYTSGYDKWKEMQGFHTGGMIGQFGAAVGKLAGAVKAHTGMMIGNLAADEVPIIAQTGEAVLNRMAVASMGGPSAINAINKGGSAGNVINITNNLNPGIVTTDDAAEYIDKMASKGVRQGQSVLKRTVGGAFGRTTGNNILPGFMPAVGKI